MPFNINSFRTNIRDFGYLDNNSFSVYVQTPPILFNSFLGNQGTPTSMQQIAQNMSFRIDQVRAPGISLVTADIPRYGIGPTQKQPYMAQFQEINFSMLCDHYCEIWQYWYNWTRTIFEYNGSTTQQTPSYTTEYKDRYSTVMSIFIHDHFGNIIQKIHLFQAYPTAVREMPMSWGDPNLMKVNVQVAYTEYVIEGSTLQPRAPIQPPGPNPSARTRTLNTGSQRETITE
jgi:hypothetical protein